MIELYLIWRKDRHWPSHALPPIDRVCRRLDGPEASGDAEADELGFSNREMVPAEANQKEIYRDVDPLAAPWRKPSLSMFEGVGEALRRESDDRVRSK